MKRLARTLWTNESAAVAPTLAIIMFMLVAVGGIAFDWSRMATLDTELQNAADQAALAAASQLDGEANAVDRATSAARNLVANLTYFANDSDPDATNITIASVEFYSSYNPDRANLSDSPGNATTSDADALYVRVTVETRRANFAFTPVVAAFGGNVTAHALAGMGSAFCNVPPFMVCRPDATFNPDDHIGAGMRLVIGSATTPGNFGFLQTGFGSGAENLARAIGYNDSFGGCVAARGVVTEPGDKQSVRAAFNTRFDMSESGQTCPAGGTCSPSTNTRKDLVRGNTCGTSGTQGWRETDHPYRAPNTSPLGPSNPMQTIPTTVVYPDVMGHPRDLCHAVSEDGSCTVDSNGILGDGNWDRDAYFQVNYGWDSAASATADSWTTRTGLSSTATRYEVYLWEDGNPTPSGTGLPGIGTTQAVQVSGGSGTVTRTAYGQPVCRSPGISPSDPDSDRRRTTVAVVDCTGLNGRDTVMPDQWMDVFLVEPTFTRGTGANARTGNGDIYVEIIGGRALPGLGGSSGDIVRRDVPQLLE